MNEMSFKVYALYGQNGHYSWASLIGQMSFKAFRTLIDSLGYQVISYSGPQSDASNSIARGLNLPPGCYWTVGEKGQSTDKPGHETAYYGVAIKPYEARRKKRVNPAEEEVA